MLPGSGNTVRQHGCSRWNFVAIMYTTWDIHSIFTTSGLWPPPLIDSRHAQTWDSIPSRLSLLPDPRHVGVAVGILLLSCIRAEIHLISYLLPVNGRHLWFMIYPVIEQYSSRPSLLRNPKNMVVAAGISLLSRIRAEIHLISYLLPVNGRHL